MKKFLLLSGCLKLIIGVLLSCLFFLPILSDEKKLKSEIALSKCNIVSVGLFKNGYALIKREIEISKTGVYYIEILSNPVHGTLWMQGNLKFISKATTIEVEESLESIAPSNIQENLAGQKVTIHFKKEGILPIQGVILKVAKKKDPSIPSLFSRYDSVHVNSENTYSRDMLAIETENGFSYVDKDIIAYIQTAGKNTNSGKRIVEKKVIEINVSEIKASEKIEIMYLSFGLTWAPSYQIDLIDEKLLNLTQQAIIKNDFENIVGVKTHLISGFPNINYAATTSLFTATSIRSFLSQINSNNNMSRSGAMTQQSILVNNGVGPSFHDSNIISAGNKDIDLHFFDAGNIDLKLGDAYTFQMDKAKSSYEKIVEWTIPDTRDSNGRYINDYERRNEPDKYDESAWDAIRFKNPFKHPMTTGPAMIVSKGNFNGQTTSMWTNPDEKTNIRITKALSIRTKHTESQKNEDGEIVQWGGSRFRKTTISGNLILNNLRGEAVKVIAKRKFSGELIASEGNPKASLNDDGAYSVNKRNELTWEISLNPGEEKIINYSYTVLASH